MGIEDYLAATDEKYLTDEAYYQEVKTALQKISQILGPPGAADRAAGMITQFLDQ